MLLERRSTKSTPPMPAKGLERKGNAESGVCPAAIPTATSRAPYLERGMLLHVPQQLWLLGCCVVAHCALELFPWKEAEDKVSEARLAAPTRHGASTQRKSRFSEGIKSQDDQLSASRSRKEPNTEGREGPASPREALSGN